MQQLRTAIVIDNDADRRAATTALLADAPVDLVSDCPHGVQASAQTAVVQPNVVLAAVTEPLDDTIATLQAIVDQCPHTHIIAYTEVADPTVLRQLAQLGVTDLLPQPFDADDLTNAIANIPFAQPDEKTGHVLTVFGAKGGIGKSTIATSIAVTIAQDVDTSVLIIDLDTRFGDIAIMMDVDARATISDMARMADKLTPDTFTRAVVTHESGVQILAAPRHPSEWGTIGADQIQTIVDVARRSYDYIILDTPGTFNDIVATAIETADRVLAVSSLELTSIKDTAHLLDLLEAEGYPKERILLTINDVNRVKAIRTPDVSQIVRHDVFWEIPYDEQIIRATQIGRPVVTARPEARASNELRAMAAHLTGSPLVTAPTVRRNPITRLVGGAWNTVTAPPRWVAKRIHPGDTTAAPTSPSSPPPTPVVQPTPATAERAA